MLGHGHLKNSCHGDDRFGDCRHAHHSRFHTQAYVIAVGPGARDEKGVVQPLDLKSGDRVLFGKWSGSEVKIDGEELLIMKESDILGVLEGGAASKKKAA
jgi:co-chaperonin GroES (HSP10)